MAQNMAKVMYSPWRVCTSIFSGFAGLLDSKATTFVSTASSVMSSTLRTSSRENVEA
eukprot:CAMPEP_0198223124 /NCGR_PEP_ID=MMETSP1445-20131203/91090_1 /TAXON_ID=36898 /ORGANISM="Pyramimonas sp., Strain CCMP2087" /LENGTH=56 /DNA_ID=CAMNT_0043901865 /DNA_START=248 /DNA_END=414 /DNA_ORIENTATION=+